MWTTLGLLAATLNAEFCMFWGVTLQLNLLLTPVPWALPSNRDNLTSFLELTPYVEPPGYLVPNPSCPGIPSSNLVPQKEKPKPDYVSHPLSRRFSLDGDLDLPHLGTSSDNNVSQVGIWIGPLGSCSRDADGREFCTESSYAFPQYNLSYVQENDILTPASIIQATKRHNIVAAVALSIVGVVLLCVIMSFPFWFPRTALRLYPNTTTQSFAILMAILFVIVALIEVLVILAPNVSPLVEKFNSVENFYFPAPCGQVRQRKPGLLLVARSGETRSSLFLGWGIVFPFTVVQFLLRYAYVQEFAESAEGRSITAVRKAAAREKTRKREQASVGMEGESLMLR